jgi:hypothetical protein
VIRFSRRIVFLPANSRGSGSGGDFSGDCAAAALSGRITEAPKKAG